MKKISCILLLACCSYKFCYCQSTIPTPNPNYVHDRITDILIKSDYIILPDSVNKIMKNYAFTKSLREVLVFKNQGVLKIMYNKNISNEDKLFACDFFIVMNEKPYSYVPVYFLKELKSALLKTIKEEKK